MSKHVIRRAVALASTVFALTAAAGSDEPVDYHVLAVPKAGSRVAHPAPKFQFLFGSPTKWPSPIRWKYNHANAPSPFDSDKSATIAQVLANLDKWTQVCGVTYVYEGETSTPPGNSVQGPFGEQPDYENVVGWGSLAQNTAGITWAWQSSDAPEIVDADIILSVTNVRSIGAMDRTASHEWGHALGLSHSDYNGALMSGPPETVYNSLGTLTPDDVRGCRCLYGPPAGQQAGYSCNVPRRIDLGIVGVGAASAPRAVTFRNEGNGPLVMNGAFVVRLSRDDGCAPGTVLAPGESCTVTIVARPMAEAHFTAELRFETSDGTYPVTVTYDASSTQPPGTPIVQLVEYQHTAFGHYFVTHIPVEIASLDNGTIPGWSRTGYAINAWPDASGATVPVCRFFSAGFAPKSSHFYTSFADECQTAKGKSEWTFEGEVFNIALPDGQGVCPSATVPVYRLYNDGQSGAPNHRFTTLRAVREQMIAQGWKPEGRGAGVTMCSPL
jgi:hypothetical protein